jgi:hypothetical protein
VIIMPKKKSTARKSNKANSSDVASAAAKRNEQRRNFNGTSFSDDVKIEDRRYRVKAKRRYNAHFLPRWDTVSYSTAKPYFDNPDVIVERVA